MSPELIQEAREIARELDRLISNFLTGLGSVGPPDDAELKQYLWDNKVGILRIMEQVSHMG